MAAKSGIGWTDHTFSPWEGCQKAGPGCEFCYAEARNARFGGGEAPNWGPGRPRRLTADSSWRNPVKWNREDAFAPRRTRVFPSLCDPFDNAIDPAWRFRFFELIDATPNLEWLLLTKRIGNVLDMTWDHWGPGLADNVRLGATMVNQEEVDRDWTKLIAIDTPHIMISIEPMLAPVVLPKPLLERKPWIIVGCESGPFARRFDLDWARPVRDQCAAFGAPFFMKQVPADNRKRATDDVAVFPEDLRIQEFPHA